jgi:hypothetical protein
MPRSRAIVWMDSREASVFRFGADEIERSLRGTRQWYLVGPDGTKQGLVDYLDKYKSRDGHIADLCRHLASISIMDRPTDEALLAVPGGQPLGAVWTRRSL